MKKFIVAIEKISVYEVEVEASSKKQAKELAREDRFDIVEDCNNFVFSEMKVIVDKKEEEE
tara:strand:+ start:1561 stop:1743 length:183 start_codon:yes stop_codon:yes gene_type:complete